MVNLIPQTPGATPSYWCTWSAQGYDVEGMDPTKGWGVDNLSETLVFEDPGWAIGYYSKVHGDLYLLFDLGWDVPPGSPASRTEQWRLGRLEPDPARFPSCRGTPVERLRTLNRMTRDAGWRGAGLWVPAQAFGDGEGGRLLDNVRVEALWRERARWCHDAGIAYWKVDFGARAGDLGFRALLTRIAREEAPGLHVEHARNCGPLNDDNAPYDEAVAHHTGRFASWGDASILERAVDLLAHSTVVRTYDVSTQLSVATTLDRVAQTLAAAAGQPDKTGLLNCEDEVYLGAALGCAVGVMRHPCWRDAPGKPYDPYELKKRSDEVVRAVCWQRLAPAFAPAKSTVTLDPAILVDRWPFRAGETWAAWCAGQEIAQAAPARVSRGMPLPQVAAEGDRPFVVASRHPNGCVAVATLPRSSPDRRIETPPADVALDIGWGEEPVGIFGTYRTLTLRLAGPRGARRIWAQDLAGDVARDVTEYVLQGDDAVTLPGALIRDIGLSAASAGDRSGPGAVLALR